MNYFKPFYRLVLFCALALFVNACKKSDDPDYKEYVVKEIYANDKLSCSFEYNNNWQVTTSKTTFNVGPEDWAHQTTSYTYNSAGQLVKTEMVNTVRNLIPLNDVRTEYTYNNLGWVSLAKAFDLKTGVLLYSDEYTYHDLTIFQTRSVPSGLGFKNQVTVDVNGNIVERVMTMDTASTPYLIEKWSDFDDKNNIAIRDAGPAIYQGPIVGNVMSKNNYRTYTSEYHLPNVLTDNMTCEYSYNGAGYVTNCTTKHGSALGSNIKYVLTPKE